MLCMNVLRACSNAWQKGDRMPNPKKDPGIKNTQHESTAG